MPRRIRDALQALFPVPEQLEGFIIDYGWTSLLLTGGSVLRQQNALITGISEGELQAALLEHAQRTGVRDKIQRILQQRETPPTSDSASQQNAISLSFDNATIWGSEHFQDTDKLVFSLWGFPTDIHSKGVPLRAALTLRVDDCEALTLSLLRLAVHGGVNSMGVTNPDLWKKRLSTISANCMGVQLRGWRPSHGNEATPSAYWAISSVVDTIRDESFIPDELARSLSKSMDLWCLERLDTHLGLVFEGDTSALSLEISEEFRHGMKKVWTRWRDILNDRELLEYLFSTVMLSDEPSRSSGLLRAGPKTLETCLLKATIFALGIETALECDLQPQHGRLPANLLLGSSAAQLVGLELVRGLRISQRAREIPWRTSLVLLAHEQTPSSALPQWRRIGAPVPSNAGFRSLADNSVLFLTQDPEFVRLLQGSPQELRTYLQDQLKTLSQGQPSSALAQILERLLEGVTDAQE